MNITISTLKAVIHKLNYKWFEDRPNIIGIRTTLNVPDIFNDFLVLVYKNNLNEVLKIYPFTTDPGVAYQKKLLNSKGCAVIKPGQYENCYSLGLHQNKTDHRALIQTGPITALRDKDLDGIAGNSGIEDTGYFGCNIHGAQKAGITKNIGPWSGGGSVFPVWKDKEETMDICSKFKEHSNNKFTYTVIKELNLNI